VGIKDMSSTERNIWLEEARLSALLGSSSATRKSLRSGVSCYIAFVGDRDVLVLIVCACKTLCMCADATRHRGNAYFPPDLDVLLAWSTLFRSHLTFSNYLGYVKTACMLVKAPVEAGL
jgi:hypothetical protein